MERLFRTAWSCAPVVAMLLACSDHGSSLGAEASNGQAGAVGADPEAGAQADPEAAAPKACALDAGPRPLIQITALSPGEPDACGVSSMEVTFDFYPSGSCTPTRDLHQLDFAGTPLTSTCASLLGLTVGSFYGNVELLDGGAVEDLTPSEITYEACSNAYEGLLDCDGGRE